MITAVAQKPIREFSSSQLQRLIPGLTLRRLQHWDENGTCPHTWMDGHRRIYTYRDAFRLAFVMELRKKGLSLPRIRKALRSAKTLLEADDVNYLAFDGKMNPVISLDVMRFLREACARPQPLIVVSLEEIRARLD